MFLVPNKFFLNFFLKEKDISLYLFFSHQNIYFQVIISIRFEGNNFDHLVISHVASLNLLGLNLLIHC